MKFLGEGFFSLFVLGLLFLGGWALVGALLGVAYRAFQWVVSL